MAKKKATKKKATKKKATKKKATKKKATKKKRKANPALLKPIAIGEALHPVIGKKPLARGQIMKALWKYIKDPKTDVIQEGRNITPDAALAKVFGTKKTIDMFKMVKLINKHLG